MGQFLDTIPFSGIIRIRDMMYSVKDPFRLDQGDVSFDAPDTVKAAMRRAIDENRSHYLQTTGRAAAAGAAGREAADEERHPDRQPRRNHGDDRRHPRAVHRLPGAARAGRRSDRPGSRVAARRRQHPLAHGVPVPCPLHESLGWRYDLDELASKITPKTRAIYVNSPDNPTGGVLTRDDIEAIAALAERHDLWIISDEAYEDVVFDEAEHVSPASLPGMYERTISFYTFSKTYAMTGLRLGYVAREGREAARPDEEGALLHRQQRRVGRAVRRRRRARRIAGGGRRRSATSCRPAAICSTRGIREHAGDVFSGAAAEGGVLRVPAHQPRLELAASGSRETRCRGR